MSQETDEDACCANHAPKPMEPKLVQTAVPQESQTSLNYPIKTTQFKRQLTSEVAFGMYGVGKIAIICSHLASGKMFEAEDFRYEFRS